MQYLESAGKHASNSHLRAHTPIRQPYLPKVITAFCPTYSFRKKMLIASFNKLTDALISTYLYVSMLVFMFISLNEPWATLHWFFFINVQINAKSVQIIYTGGASGGLWSCIKYDIKYDYFKIIYTQTVTCENVRKLVSGFISASCLTVHISSNRL